MEDELLEQLAERPDDRSLRLVLSDWLQEHGDPRGEVIALWARGHLSLTERRRIQRLTEQHAAEWLGPLAAVADLPRCRFEGGFPVELALTPRGTVTFAPRAPAPAAPSPPPAPAHASPAPSLTLAGIPIVPTPLPVAGGAPPGAPDELAAGPHQEWFVAPLIGDPRWATVRSLVVPLSLTVGEVATLLGDPVFKHLERIEAGARVLAQLRAPMRPAFTLEAVALASWATFNGDFGALLEADAIPARRLELATSEFVNPLIAREIRETLVRAREPGAPPAPAQLTEEGFAASAVLARYDEVRLLAPYGVMEGVAAWLSPGAHLGMIERTWTRGQAWSVTFSDVLFRLERTRTPLAIGHRPLRRLVADLTGPEGTLGLGQRLATVAGVLVMLGGSQLAEIEVLVPEGARLRPAERDALRAAARRLGTIESFRIGGLQVTP